MNGLAKAVYRLQLKQARNPAWQKPPRTFRQSLAEGWDVPILVGNFIDCISSPHAVGDLDTDRITGFRLGNIYIVNLH